jgi:site-specific recombinase XerD
MTPIAPLIETFLRETLACQRGASRHTSDSYASSFQLLFVFAAERFKVKPSALTLEQIDAGLVSAFLEHLEDVRKNVAVTRNVRLAAIKSFFRFLEYLVHSHRCPCCGGRMIIVETFERGTTPRTRPAISTLTIGFDSS